MVYTWVVEDSAATVTDFVSFYSVPVMLLAKGSVRQVGRVDQACLWYHCAVTVPTDKLISNALILAKSEGFDMFLALDVAGLTAPLQAAGFRAGTGSLRYYLFNWRGHTMHKSHVGYIAR